MAIGDGHGHCLPYRLSLQMCWGRRRSVAANEGGRNREGPPWNVERHAAPGQSDPDRSARRCQGCRPRSQKQHSLYLRL